MNRCSRGRKTLILRKIEVEAQNFIYYSSVIKVNKISGFKDEMLVIICS